MIGKIKTIKLPPVEYIKTLLEYDKETGNLLWKLNRGNARKGDVAGTFLVLNNTTYVSIRIDGIKYLSHRLIYKMHNTNWDEENIIDHIHKKQIADNRIENLRAVSQSINTHNVTRNNKTSLYKGVCFDKNRNKWRADIQINGKTINIGRYENEVEAALAYNEKAHILFGENAVLNTFK